MGDIIQVDFKHKKKTLKVYDPYRDTARDQQIDRVVGIIDNLKKEISKISKSRSDHYNKFLNALKKEVLREKNS